MKTNRYNFHLLISLFSVLSIMASGLTMAQCNGGVAVTGPLVISSSCGGSIPLNMGAGAEVAVNSGVTILNFGGNRNSDGISVLSSSTSSSLINNGTVSSGDQFAININGVLDSLINFETISSGRRGVVNGGTIGTLTNVGTITRGIFQDGITNSSVITNLNNLQGLSNAAGPLAISRNLPVNYNIIINGPSSYGQLSAPSPNPGSMAFNIYGNIGTSLVLGVGASSISANRYLNVLQEFTSLSNVTGITGTYGRFAYSLLANDTLANSWDLLVFLEGPSITDTQASLQQIANNLKGSYALQTSAINIGLTYDCNTFDSNKICVSTGGRYSRVSTGDNSTNGLLIGAYKLNDKVRLGAYLDQNLSSSNAASGINLSNSNPLFGVFGVWNHQADQLGYSVRVAAGYGDRDLSLTRQVIGTSEAGSGSTRLNSQAASITGSYALPVHSQWIASPFVGIRYTKVSSSAYSEQASSTVSSPLTFDSLVQETTTALAGVKLSGNLMPKIGLFGSVGIEQDLNNHGDNYSATGITGLTAINFNPNLQKTRPVANLGASYQIDKTQQISFNAIYRQEAFQSTNTLTSLVTYTAGF